MEKKSQLEYMEQKERKISQHEDTKRRAKFEISIKT